MVPFNSPFFYFFSEQFFMKLWPKKKKLVQSKHPKAKQQAEYCARLKTGAEKWAAYCLKHKLLVKNCWDNLKQEQEEEQKMKSSMRYKLKKSMTLLKYMFVPEAENIPLEYYKSFTL